MYCVVDHDYLRDFTMMVNEDIIDCFSEEKPENRVIHIINQVIKDNKDTLQKIKQNEKLHKNIITKNINNYNGKESYKDNRRGEIIKNFENRCSRNRKKGAYFIFK